MHQKPVDDYIEKNRRTVSGHSTEFQINEVQSQIQIDIPVSEFTTVRVWGQIKNKYNRPVEGVMLQLVRVIRMAGKEDKYQGLGHTISDCHGFYQFDLCASSLDACYQIFANKTAIGPQWYIPSEREHGDMNQEHKSKREFDSIPEQMQKYSSNEHEFNHHMTMESSLVAQGM